MCSVLLSLGTSILDVVLFEGVEVFRTVAGLGLVIPGLALAVRRLHDVDRSGWWVLSAFTFVGGFFPLLYWYLRTGTQGTNRYGSDPLPSSSTTHHEHDGYQASDFDGRAFMRTAMVAVAVATVALVMAFVGAVIIGSDSGIDEVNLFVERLSGDSGSWLGGLVGASALFALAAGMASAVNPCGFAMLPAYLGMYLGDKAEKGTAVQPVRHFAKALTIGLTVTAGFVVLFGIVGAIIGLGANFIGDLLQWLGLVIGIGLAIVGAWTVGGGKLYTGVAARAASHLGNPAQVSMKGYFIFGISYGTASLSCTLPIFLAVVGISVAGTSATSVLGDFLLFALGMGVVILALTLGMAFFKTAMVGGLRKAMPYVQPVGSWLMVIAGMYIVFYWLTIGDLR